jgi:hypothetical protein
VPRPFRRGRCRRCGRRAWWCAGAPNPPISLRGVGNHTFRATGVTAYLKNGGTLERAAQMANLASTRTPASDRELRRL